MKMFKKIIIYLFPFFFLNLDYDPVLVPIVYPTDDVEPSTLDSEIQRQLEEKRRLDEEKRRLEEEEAARRKPVTELPSIIDRFNVDEQDRINEIENERENEHENEHEHETEQNAGQDTDHATPRVPKEYLNTTIFVKPTKRRPSKQDSACKLPVEPELDVGYEAGFRFGTAIDSRIEFNDVPSKLRKGYDISLEFKTNHSDGVLFYAADSRHTDFIVLYLKDGYVCIQMMFKFIFKFHV